MTGALSTAGLKQNQVRTCARFSLHQYYATLMQIAPKANVGRIHTMPGVKSLFTVVYCLCLITVSRSLAGEEKTLSAQEVIEKAVQHAQQTENRLGQTDFTYTKVSVTEELDSHGKVKERREKIYRVYFQKGATFAKLIELNGRPIGAADAKALGENDGTTKQVLGDAKPMKGE